MLGMEMLINAVLARLDLRKEDVIRHAQEVRVLAQRTADRIQVIDERSRVMGERLQRIELMIRDRIIYEEPSPTKQLTGDK